MMYFFVKKLRRRNKKLLAYLDAMYLEADSETDAQMYAAIIDSINFGKSL